ncbi:YqaJ viral recombinase family protein [Rhodococcus qingshengii]|nr:YqaJ viral recombinase family protein [Rhodococcus qingshengii]MDJ0490639.1 YqaJ viral recombinase family protein [Rhodococcus qingshengii]
MSASKISQLLGLCSPKWGDEFTLWHEMRFERHLEKQTDVMARGHEFEPLIREWFARDHPHLEVRLTSTWAHKDRAWQTADPDAEAWTTDGVLELVEIKTANDIHDRDEWGEPGSDEIPLKYRAQAIWQMATIGARRVHFAVCGPFELFERKPRYFVVEFDAADAALLLDRAEKFMQSLALGIEPARVNPSDKTMMAVRHKNTWIEDIPVELPDEIGEPYVASRGECQECRRAKESSIRVLEFMGSAKRASYRGATVAHRINGRKGAPPYLRAANNLK